MKTFLVDELAIGGNNHSTNGSLGYSLLANKNVPINQSINQSINRYHTICYKLLASGDCTVNKLKYMIKRGVFQFH